MREKELLEKGLKSNVCMQNWNMYSIKYMFIMQTVNFAQTVLKFILFYFKDCQRNNSVGFMLSVLLWEIKLRFWWLKISSLFFKWLATKTNLICVSSNHFTERGHQMSECLTNNLMLAFPFCFRNKVLALSWTLKRIRAWYRTFWTSKNSWTAS